MDEIEQMIHDKGLEAVVAQLLREMKARKKDDETLTVVHADGASIAAEVKE